MLDWGIIAHKYMYDYTGKWVIWEIAPIYCGVYCKCTIGLHLTQAMIYSVYTVSYDSLHIYNISYYIYSLEPLAYFYALHTCIVQLIDIKQLLLFQPVSTMLYLLISPRHYSYGKTVSIRGVCSLIKLGITDSISWKILLIIKHI